MLDRTEGPDRERSAREQAALLALRARTAALGTKVAAVAVFLVVVVGFLGLVAFRSAASPHGVHGRNRDDLGFLVPAALIAALAGFVARALLRGRRDRWIAELAIAHDVDPDALRAALDRV